MAATVLVNGRPDPSISALDRGLAFGDGIFRTMAVRGGRILNAARHFERLRHDARVLGLDEPDESLARKEVAFVAPGDATVKLILTRGEGGRGYAPPEVHRATRIVAAFPPLDYPPELSRAGVAVRRCSLVLGEQSRLAGVKSLNRLENVLARAEWSDPAIREGLLGDASGHLVEGTMSNVFLVSAGILATPGLERCGVVGAQRERVRDLAGRAGIACAVRDLSFAELEDADEVFLTNSLIGVWPVAAFGKRRWAPGPVTRAMQALVEADDA